MAGIAIGGTVGICAIAAWDFSYLWIYVTAPFIGAAVAVVAWTYIYRHPRAAAEVDEVTEAS